MALTVTLSSPVGSLSRPVGSTAAAVETVNDSTSTAVPPATTTYTEPGLTTRIASVTFDSSYATNGESLVAADVGLSSIAKVVCTMAVKSDGSDAYWVEYDYANSKLLAYRDAATAIAFVQVPNTTNLAAYTCVLLIFGHP